MAELYMKYFLYIFFWGGEGRDVPMCPVSYAYSPFQLCDFMRVAISTPTPSNAAMQCIKFSGEDPTSHIAAKLCPIPPNGWIHP